MTVQVSCLLALVLTISGEATGGRSSECWQKYVARKGNFSSPGFPVLSNEFLSCDWDITSNYTDILTLTFDTFDLPPSSHEKNCIDAYVNYGYYNSQGKRITQEKVCGGSKIHKYTVMSSWVWVSMVIAPRKMSLRTYKGLHVTWTIEKTSLLTNQLIVGLVSSVVIPIVCCLPAFSFYWDHGRKNKISDIQQLRENLSEHATTKALFSGQIYRLEAKRKLSITTEKIRERLYSMQSRGSGLEVPKCQFSPSPSKRPRLQTDSFTHYSPRPSPRLSRSKVYLEPSPGRESSKLAPPVVDLDATSVNTIERRPRKSYEIMVKEERELFVTPRPEAENDILVPPGANADAYSVNTIDNSQIPETRKTYVLVHSEETGPFVTPGPSEVKATFVDETSCARLPRGPSVCHKNMPSVFTFDVDEHPMSSTPMPLVRLNNRKVKVTHSGHLVKSTRSTSRKSSILQSPNLESISEIANETSASVTSMEESVGASYIQSCKTKPWPISQPSGTGVQKDDQVAPRSANYTLPGLRVSANTSDVRKCSRSLPDMFGDSSVMTNVTSDEQVFLEETRLGSLDSEDVVTMSECYGQNVDTGSFEDNTERESCHIKDSTESQETPFNTGMYVSHIRAQPETPRAVGAADTSTTETLLPLTRKIITTFGPDDGTCYSEQCGAASYSDREGDF